MPYSTVPLAGTVIASAEVAEILSKLVSLKDRWHSGYSETHTGLNITVATGIAFIAGYRVGKPADTAVTVAMTANATNYVYLQYSAGAGNIVVNQTGVAPANSILLYTAITGASAVTGSPTDNRDDEVTVLDPLKADELTSVAGVYGTLLRLLGSQPYVELNDSSGGGTAMRIWCRNGKVQLTDTSGATIYHDNLLELTAHLHDSVLAQQNAPPGSPAVGDRYLVGAAPSGAWVGNANSLAQWGGSSWTYRTPTEGDLVYNRATDNYLLFVTAWSNLVDGSVAPTASTLAKRGTDGSLRAVDGALSDNLTTKGYVDGLDAANDAALTSHKAAGASEHPVATTGVHGFMSSTDKTKLDAATSAATANALAQRNGSGQLSVATPSNSDHAATKAYVDAMEQGLDIKKSVRVATTAAGTLASSFENGDTVDGVVIATGDRILIKDQAAGAENGIYTVNASGAPTRATDADASAEVTGGMYVFVNEGTVNADSGWALTTNDPITLGSTALVFTQFSGAGQITAGAALTKTGNTLDVAVDNSSIEVSGDALRQKDNGTTNAKLADMAQTTVKGRASGAGTGDPTDLTATQVLDIVKTVDGAASGLDADLLDGANSAAAATASTVPVRDANGRMKAVAGIASDDVVNVGQVGEKYATFQFGSSLDIPVVVTGVADNVVAHAPSLGILWIAYRRGTTLYTKVSTDGGATFGVERTLETGKRCSLHAVDGSTAYLVYHKTSVGTRFAKTTDGGQNWTYTTINVYTGEWSHGATSISVVGSTIWIAHCSASQAAKVAVSTNSGTSFTESTSQVVGGIVSAAVVGFDANTAYLASQDAGSPTTIRIFKTTTGLNGWFSSHVSATYSLVYNGRNVVYWTAKDATELLVTWSGGNAGGGNTKDALYAIQTQNGGTNWTTYSLDPPSNILCSAIRGGVWNATEMLLPVVKDTSIVLLRGINKFRLSAEQTRIGGFDMVSGSDDPPHVASMAYDGADYYFVGRAPGTDVVLAKSRYVRVI